MFDLCTLKSVEWVYGCATIQIGGGDSFQLVASIQDLERMVQTRNAIFQPANVAA